MLNSPSKLSFTFLFEVPILQVKKQELKDLISNLEKNQKQAVQFAYSEVFLRSLRNSDYKKAVSKFWNICDGKGLRWAVAVTNNFQAKQDFSSKRSAKRTLKTFWQAQIDFLFFFLKACKILIIALVTIPLNYSFPKTKLENILGRNFVYDILEIANKKQWSVSIIGGSELLAKNLSQKYTNIKFSFWFKEFNSYLMKDISHTELVQQKFFGAFDLVFKHQILNFQNLFKEFPDLQEAEKFLEKQKTDLILVCLGGATGKQEFFIYKILNNSKIKARAVFALGAALDHLGAGSRQARPPLFFEKTGTEWLYRYLFQPQRRYRILDSVLNLWLESAKRVKLF